MPSSRPLNAFIIAFIFAGKYIETCHVKAHENTYFCWYKPKRTGKYLLHIDYGSNPLEQSPLSLEIFPKKVSQIRAYGPGIYAALSQMKNQFSIFSNRESIRENQVSIDPVNGSAAKIEIKSKSSDILDVIYTPSSPGTYAF